MELIDQEQREFLCSGVSISLAACGANRTILIKGDDVFAENSPYPQPEQMLRNIYAGGNDHAYMDSP
ncbi:MAG: hypothetical protein KGP14_00050 [Betaproteobacteria bacterium]|nr:hypothetical protein [Betaproteobacteria bacterium]